MRYVSQSIGGSLNDLSGLFCVLLWPSTTCANNGLCLLQELLLYRPKDLVGGCDSSSSDDGAFSMRVGCVG